MGSFFQFENVLEKSFVEIRKEMHAKLEKESPNGVQLNRGGLIRATLTSNIIMG